MIRRVMVMSVGSGVILMFPAVMSMWFMVLTPLISYVIVAAAEAEIDNDKQDG